MDTKQDTNKASLVKSIEVINTDQLLNRLDAIHKLLDRRQIDKAADEVLALLIELHGIA